MVRKDDVSSLFADEYEPVVKTVYLELQDWGKAEEITQDAFVQLLRLWRRVSEHERPGARVRCIAIRLAVRVARRERAITRALRKEVPGTALSQDRVALGADVMTAVGRLPLRQRAAVALFYVEDLPVEEVAHVMACSPSTARVHLHRARQTLEKYLGEAVSSHVG